MPDPWAGRKKLLAVADVQTGYHHDSISHALATVERIGRQTGDYVTEIRTDSQLITRQPILGVGAKYGGKRVNARNLDDFDALFLLPSGEGTMSPEQKADLLAYVRDGGGLIAGHAAIIGFFDWPPFAALLGGKMAGEFMGEARVIVERPDFPGADAFGAAPFLFDEQHPLLGPPYDPADVEVIMRADPEHLDPAIRARRADDDFPLIWTRREGKGRIYNLSWGHNEATWDDPRFQAMVRGAIAWAMTRDEITSA